MALVTGTAVGTVSSVNLTEEVGAFDREVFTLATKTTRQGRVEDILLEFEVRAPS
jgi:sporulation protein YlmC with PRC-barrel domain